jgi:hypothetical protein
MDDLLPFDLPGIPNKLILGLIKELINDWENKDFERYLKIAYKDPQIQFYFETNSYNIGKQIAPIIAQAIANRMITLKNADHDIKSIED